MKHFFLICLSVFVLTAVTHAQNPKAIDSLQTIIKSTTDSITKVFTLISLSREYHENDVNKAATYGKHAFSLAEKINDLKSKGLANNNMGDVCWYQEKYSLSHDYYIKGLNIFQKINDQENIAESYRDIGWTYLKEKKHEYSLSYFLKSLEINKKLNNKNKLYTSYVDLGSFYNELTNHQDALKYFKEALTIAEETKNLKKTGYCLNKLGDSYWYIDNSTKASECYFQALKTYEQLNDQGKIADCYRNIAWIYQGQENYKYALEYFSKALKINETLKNEDKMNINHGEIGNIYKAMKNYTEALIYCNKTIKYATSTNNKYDLVMGYGNLGSIYIEMEKYNLAIEALLKSYQIHQGLGDYYNYTLTLNELAASYLKINNPHKTIEYATKAIEVAKKYNYKSAEATAYKHLGKAHAAINDYPKAFEYTQLYTTLEDSIYKETNNRQINEMSAKYESEKKELMISSLEKDKALSDEKLEQEKQFKIYLAVFCLLIVVLAFVLYRGNMQKKKANTELSYAYREIEEKNKDITDSINYSKRIQDASLPSLDLKQQLFPDSFILFKPKDIVSGDFYWFTEKNGKKLIAACDCTGHGVPGALMSMIGTHILHQIVNEKGITSAAEILNQLHIDIRKSLKQAEQTDSRDGMDIALLTFNSETEIEFAGAHRPLWILSKGILEEVKPNKFSIGGIQTEEKRIFTNHKKNLNKGDCLYIFSDGFADQFGGKEGKKFMSKQFKELLVNNSHKPMVEQESILNTSIENWRGRNEQIDDILVIGIRV